MLLKVKQLKPYSKNPKQDFSKRQYNALLKSCRDYGFIRSLFVCKDFENNTDNYIVLDGNTAIQLLNDLEYTEIDCKVIDNITDDKSAMKFIASISISKKPLYSKMVNVLGVDLSDIIGKSTKAFETIDVEQGLENAIKSNNEYVEQTSYFLSLPTDCVKRLKNFTKTKMYKNDKTEAFEKKIDSMDDTEFLNKILKVVI